MSQNPIHEAVREHYGAIARQTAPAATSCCSTDSSAVSCCGDGAGPGAALYDVALLDGLPVDVTSLSHGCGDPVTIAGLKEGETVLDLGSGGGIDCFMAAKQVGASGHVIGVDMTPDMLLRANANKIKMNARNVEFRQGQIEALPVADNTVDVIMSNCVINLSPDKAAVFAEAFRVLKPGGRVAVSDIVTEGEFSPELRAQADRWAECVTGAIDGADYTRLMREAGFVDVQIADKVSADEMVRTTDGMPRIYSARVTGRKPA